jgi:hypothetical protein
MQIMNTNLRWDGCKNAVRDIRKSYLFSPNATTKQTNKSHIFLKPLGSSLPPHSIPLVFTLHKTTQAFPTVCLHDCSSLNLLVRFPAPILFTLPLP